MPRTSNTATSTAVEAEPAPVYQVLSDDPARRARIETQALLLQAIARTESNLAKWAGGNTQFEATRFTLGGRLEALRAVYQALEGDSEALKNL